MGAGSAGAILVTVTNLYMSRVRRRLPNASFHVPQPDPTPHMKNRSPLSRTYYALALISLIATWHFNFQFFASGGSVAPGPFFGAAFANALTTAITLDVYLAALTFSVWVVVDARRRQQRWGWAWVVLCFALGLAITWPLYLARLEAQRVGNQGRDTPPSEHTESPR
jgi:hypothetical protein